MFKEREGLMVKSIPKLSLEGVYPPISSKINLNTCGDPDCGNFSVARISHCRLSRDREHSRGRWQLTGTDDFVQVWGKFETRYLNQESHQRL